jgi:hypothetical protein
LEKSMTSGPVDRLAALRGAAAARQHRHAGLAREARVASTSAQVFGTTTPSGTIW